MTLAQTLRRGRLARARGAVAEPAEEAPAKPAAGAHPETGGAGSEPTLRDWIGVLAMGTGLFMAIMDVQIVTSSLTQIQGGLSASTDEIAWVQTAYLIADVVMVLMSGILSRLLSTRILFVVAALGFTGTSVLCATATNLGQMILYRAMQGFCGGAITPTVWPVVYTKFRGRHLASVIAIISVILSLSSTLGPTLGGFLTDTLSWHWLFLVNIVEPEEVFKKTGYSRPHTVHCGPEGIYVSTLGGGGKDGTNGPPGVFIMDCETFDILGRWEIDRGPQNLHYDFWWNLPRDYMVTSEWGLPPQFENGIVPEDLLSNKYGHRIHFWDLRARRNVQTMDLGANHQMALEVRPAHDPVREYGFLGVVVDTTNLEGSIWTWWRERDKFHIEKTATIPPEPAPKDQLPPLLQGFGAVPPLVTDIDLSMDDRFLYVSCWGTGEMRQYDVSDPRKPKLAGSVHIGGIARRTPHPNGKAYAGGPQLVEISRDGKRVYWTNSLYSTWDNQFYPDGVPGIEVMANANPNGGLALAKDYWVSFPDGYRAHQIRLEGGDCSTDSFCYPSV